MTRLPYPGPPGDDRAREVEQRIVAERGELLAIYRMLLHAPGIADGWRALLTEVRRDADLPALLRELVIMRVAALNGARYEADHHRPLAIEAGARPEQLAAVADVDGRLPRADGEVFSDLEADVVALTDSLTRDVTVADELLARLAERLGPRQTVELVVTISAYNMVSRFLVALGIDDET